MSYCRKQPGTSDVYVYTDGEQIICSDCSLTPVPTDGSLAIHCEATAAGMLRHLLEGHAGIGERVPLVAVERLMRESGMTP